jgi:hypothetical protein
VSDYYLVVIPRDPTFLPTPQLATAAVTALRRLVSGADQIEIHESNHVEYRDCGQNFESVTCPSCGGDLTDHFADLMDNDFDGHGFALGRAKLPCCGAECALNELAFEMPQGFSRFAVAARNPRATPGAHAPVPADLAQALGGSAIVIHRRV